MQNIGLTLNTTGAATEMLKPGRQTVIAHGRLAMREHRLAAARERRHGLQVMTFGQFAARLAGGLSRPIDDESLREAVQTVLPTAELGELESLKALPGMIGAAVDTLEKVWRADIDLQARAQAWLPSRSSRRLFSRRCLPRCCDPPTWSIWRCSDSITLKSCLDPLTSWGSPRSRPAGGHCFTQLPSGSRFDGSQGRALSHHGWMEASLKSLETSPANRRSPV